MAQKTIPIEQVSKDFDPSTSKGVYNPLTEHFTVPYGGVDVTIEAGGYGVFPTPKSAHIAKHIAIKILNSKMEKFLMENFPGLDEQGREKWRTSVKTFYDRKDIVDLAQTLIFDVVVGESAPKISVPETKFDKMGKPAAKPKAEETESADEKLDVSDESEDEEETEKPLKKGKK